MTDQVLLVLRDDGSFCEPKMLTRAQFNQVIEALNEYDRVLRAAPWTSTRFTVGKSMQNSLARVRDSIYG